MRSKYLFESYKYCEICHRNLPLNYKEATCPACSEYALFQLVKEYIRSEDVNEYQVADRFQIPLSVVRKWIREGRIQYKETTKGKVRMHCQLCGAQITFGSICPKCLKEQNTSGTVIKPYATDPGNMRHLQVTTEE